MKDTPSQSEVIYKKRIPTSLFVGAVATLELVFLTIITYLYYKEIGVFQESTEIYLLFPLINCLIYIVLMFKCGGYDFESFFHYRKRSMSAVKAWCYAVLLTVSFMFFFKFGGLVSRYWVLFWFLTGAGCIVLFCLALKICVKYLNKLRLIEMRVVIVGSAIEAQNLIDQLNSSARGLCICGTFDDRSDERSPPIEGYPKLGSIDALVQFARKVEIDMLIVDIPMRAEARLMGMLKKLWVLPINIRISALSSILRFHKRSYSYIGNVPLLDIFDKPQSDSERIMKYWFDKIFGAIILVLVSPIMLITAIAIKLDSKGPVFFKQKRYGFNNELIQVYKFRSMYVEQSDVNAVKLVTKGDPRVTKVGRFIRKSSIDELPQLFNVLFQGNISLVGPRPHAMQAKADSRLYEDVVDGYFARHKVKPGITGYAQINGWRGETDTAHQIEKRVECDLYYISNWSIFLDMYIIAITPFALVFDLDKAY